jgi:hypothetical protein
VSEQVYIVFGEVVGALIGSLICSVFWLERVRRLRANHLAEMRELLEYVKALRK